MLDFEAERGHLFAIAYRMLGSVTDAEDIMQEAYLRARGVDPATIRSPRAFLTTMVTRLCLHQLESARVRRETYIGPWLPEPLITDDQDPSAEVERQESVSMAFMLLLERLNPVERAVFLLREVFDYSYAEIAAMVGKDEAACRQIFSRAKRFIVAQRPRFTPSTNEHHRLLDEFLRAVGSGSIDGLTQLLADDVTLWADGGGKARGAATRPLQGAYAVARFVQGTLRFLPEPYTTEFAWANGSPAIILRVAGRPAVVVCLQIAGDRITDLWVVGNPDKLRHIPPA